MGTYIMGTEETELVSGRLRFPVKNIVLYITH
jgi:hypothetical protein